MPVRSHTIVSCHVARDHTQIYDTTFYQEKYCAILTFVLIPPQWNISDYLYQNRDKIREGLEKESQDIEAQPEGCEQPVPPFDALWLTLYSRLADLCVDPRPAVRKIGGQTLFSTISAHGALLKLSTWQIVLWQVSAALCNRTVRNFIKAIVGTIFIATHLFLGEVIIVQCFAPGNNSYDWESNHTVMTWPPEMTLLFLLIPFWP